MSFSSLKIIRFIDLSEFADVYAGLTMPVWVNITMGMKMRRGAMLREFAQVALGKNPLARWLQSWQVKKTQTRLYEWLSELWSQGDDPESRWTAEEIRKLHETDPAFYQWLVTQSMNLLDGFQLAKKK